jgi:primosomal protein N' (replication factor Y)
MSIVRVALDVPLDGLFDYVAEHASAADIGLRVLVPFGPRQRVGVVMAVAENSEIDAARLKPVLRVYRDIPALGRDLLDLYAFCNRYYHHPLGEIVLNALPTGLRRAQPVRLKTALRYRLTEAGSTVSVADLPPRAVVKHRLLLQLQERGVLAGAEVAAISSSARKALREFMAAGWAEERREPQAPEADFPPPKPAPTLNAEQSHAVEAVLARLGEFQVWLLHGITGSGKTEVYLNLIGATIARGGQALVLVPEINLTPQLEATFRGRFPQACMATLHSGLGESERATHWLLAQSGTAQIVLGTRLAVFTPLPALALVIVDEEHDSSFKQQEGLRYSARDVAITRAKSAGVPVVLGSATPALESYYNARLGRYQLLALNRRAADSAALPQIHCIDTRRRKLVEGLSEPLLAALAERLQKGEQSLVFINRRGYAPVLMCGECGWLSTCPRCSTRLVIHLRDKRLRCHQCGHEARVPSACPDCGNMDLKALGQGTQRVEDALSRLLPTARVLRIDRDSTRRKGAWEGMLKQVQDHEVDILVGTQILAKGHDFPKISLVGILNADGALYSADFRASERLFAQLMQVSGRAGRADIPGEVLIQTEFPDHALFQALRSHDFTAYAEALLSEREQAGFPPFVHQALLRAEAPQLDTALDFLARAKAAAATLDYPVLLFDPVEAQMMRHSGKERAQLLVQSSSRGALQAFLTAWHAMLSAQQSGKARWYLDVDPIEF